MNDSLNAAVAHDAYNALSAIQLLAENLTDGHTSQLQTMSIGRTLERRVSEAGEILQELLESARITSHADPQPPADLQSTIEASDTLPRRLCGRTLALDITHTGPTARLELPRIRLVQSLVNLTLNAIVRVTDNGHGMPEEVSGHFFEIFFTSKPGSGGTGLGLFEVRELIERAGGSVTVESSPGKGTTFRLRIPILQTNIETAAASPSMSPSVRRTALRVIIADDEPTIRDLPA